MKEVLSRITSKGQVTIPAEIRRHLGVKTHDQIAFVLSASGEVRIQVPQASTVAALRGAAGSLSRPLSWQEMKQIANEDRLKTNRSP